MSAGAQALRLRWRAATPADVDTLLAIEQQAYSHPWTRGNFLDSLAAGHWAWLGRGDDEELACYWLAMPVLDELHLLNLAVLPSLWGQGLGGQALAHLHAEATAQHVAEVWLEVRESNARAQALYLQHGYVLEGRRPGYYPAGGGKREDALLMRRRLAGACA